METICGLGLPEMVIIALLAFVVIGPERSQEVALQAGRFLRNIMSSEWWSDFNEITGALRNLPNTLVRMAELEEAQKEIQSTMRDINTLSGDATSTDAAPADRMTTDPWGMMNATAKTTYYDDPQPTEEQPAKIEDEPTDEPEEPSIDDDVATTTD